MTEETTLWWLKLRRGLAVDFENLISEFVATKTVRYEKFANIWKDMNFGLIYCGLSSSQQKEEFMEEAFQLAVMYLSPPFDFQQRTGGLYLLYALYFTQVNLPPVKVRLSLKHWQYLMELYKDLKKQGHLDACYILMRLRAQKAFCFVHSTKQFTPYTPVMEENREKWLAENQREIEQAIPEDLLRQMHSTHIKYQVLKETLGLAEEERMSFVKKSMAEIIANRVQNISDESEDEKNRNKQAENRGDRIAQIKSKSFSFGVLPEDDEPQSTATAETSGEEDGSSPSSKGRFHSRGPGRRPKAITKLSEKPLVERLMPKLQKYTVSDSEEEKDDVPVNSVKEQNQTKPTNQRTAEKRLHEASKDEDTPPGKVDAQNERKSQRQRKVGRRKQVSPKGEENPSEKSKVQNQGKGPTQKKTVNKPQVQTKGKETPSKTNQSQKKTGPSGQKSTGKKNQDKGKGSKRPAARPNLVNLPFKKRKNNSRS